MLSWAEYGLQATDAAHVSMQNAGGVFTGLQQLLQRHMNRQNSTSHPTSSAPSAAANGCTTAQQREYQIESESAGESLPSKSAGGCAPESDMSAAGILAAATGPSKSGLRGQHICTLQDLCQTADRIFAAAAGPLPDSRWNLLQGAAVTGGPRAVTFSKSHEEIFAMPAS
ncbi:hypothetical protein L7F22_014898 [Adiantum nelumboides]|nr:hypothetical protein [Adiantum nelumboides]